MAECLMVYFVNSKGKISLPPDFTTPAPPGYDRRECHSIGEIQWVEKALTQEARDRLDQEWTHEQQMGWTEVRRDIRSRMMTTIKSSVTSPYERDFLIAWMQLRDERRREQYKKMFEQHQAYVEMLHYDKPRTPEEVMGESL